MAHKLKMKRELDEIMMASSFNTGISPTNHRMYTTVTSFEKNLFDTRTTKTFGLGSKFLIYRT